MALLEISGYGPDGTAIMGTDKNLYPKFYWRDVQHEWESTQQGRPIFERKAYVRILMAGDAKTEIDQPVTEEDKARWPHLWQSFQATGESPLIGTPLEQWPQVGADRASRLAAINIRTVEQLAAVPDAHLDNIGMDGRRLRDAAKNFITQAADAGALNRLKLELDEAKEQIALLVERSRGRKKHTPDETAELQLEGA